MKQENVTAFGEQLRRLRERAGLTQAELAERAGLTAKAISALERGERRQPYPATVHAIANVLALSPDERAALLRARLAPAVRPEPVEAGGPSSAPAPAAPSGGYGHPAHNLPAQMSSFIGRTTELADLAALLRTHRFVTLSGAGGSGKTRLALAVAAEVAADYPDGAWLVELAGLTDPAFVLDSVINALGLRAEPGADLGATLVAHLRPRELLLLLDNCEHLVDACAALAERLLTSCPQLHICVTSREVLRVPGEHIYMVPTLPAPPNERLSLAALDRYDAVRLFVERAAAQQPAFQLVEANAEAVNAICRRLDGIPLAIELAAARVRTMPPQLLVERLDQSLRVLTSGSRTAPPRQQTLRNTLDWSHALLGEPERRLFRRLSAFVGGWDLEAAEVVGASYAANDAPVSELLARLVEQSLVVVEPGDPDGRGRFRMLEPVRQYGLQLLEESGELASIRSRHAALYLALAEQAYPELRRSAQVRWLDRLGHEHDNIRAALGWALRQGEIEVAARLGWSLWPFWWIRAYHREGRRWLEQVCARGAELPLRLRTRATMACAAMAYGQGDNEATIQLMQEVMALADQAGGDAHAAGYAHAGFGLVAVNRGEIASAVHHLELCLPLLAQSGEEGMAAQTHVWLGTVLLLSGDHAAAARRLEQGLAAGRILGDRLSICNALYNLAQLALATGATERAAALLREGIPLSHEMGDRANIAFILQGLAVVAANADGARAVRLLGGAEHLIDRIGLRGHTYYKPDQLLYDRVTAELRAQLGPARFAAAWDEGRALSYEQLITAAHF